MTTIKNLVGSPFDVQTLSGQAIIEAFGTLEAEFEPGYLNLLLTCLNIVLDESEEQQPAAEAEAVSEESPEEEPAVLEHVSDADKYMALTGKKPDGRWSDERLAEEIAKLEA